MPNLSSHRPLRVLHVLGTLKPGGTQTWLLQLLREADRSRLAMDFLVTDGWEDPRVLALGAKIVTCPQPHRPWVYAKDFWRILRAHGPYDVVHGHVHHYTGWVLTIAALAGVPVRISHSHGDTSSDDAKSSAARRLYLAMMQSLMRQSATAGFACSTEAGAALYGRRWQQDRRWSVLPCGIDLDPFHAPARTSLRDELSIPCSSFVVGHVGRFVELKNHSFLIDIAQAAAGHGSLHFLLVGDGELRPEIEQRVTERGLNKMFTFAGMRDDVPDLMRRVMDAFVLPSRREGLPVVLVEAQAAGLPCLVSDTVSSESKAVEGLVFWESLGSSPEAWAKRLLALRRDQSDSSREVAWRALEGGPFDIRSNLEILDAYYSKERC